jgi:hypothetical protein
MIIQLAGKSIFLANCAKTTSLGGASEQCVMRTARVLKPLPAKEITMKKPRKFATEAHLNGNGQERLGTANLIPSDTPALLAKQKGSSPRGRSPPKPRRAHGDRRGRRQVQTQRNWFAATAAAAISRRRSSSATTLAAPPVSNSGTVPRHETRTPLEPAKQQWPSNFLTRWRSRNECKSY